MTAPTVILERAAALILAGDPVPLEDRQEVAVVLYARVRQISNLHDAMVKLKAPRLERDACVHALGKFFHTGSYTARAAHIHTELKRYAERTWQRTRIEESCPHHADTREAATWAVLQSKGGEDLTPYRISIILRERDTAGRREISR
jgi:hypothetical protein